MALGEILSHFSFNFEELSLALMAFSHSSNILIFIHFQGKKQVKKKYLFVIQLKSELNKSKEHYQRLFIKILFFYFAFV
jgi:hypothetical protein